MRLILLLLGALTLWQSLLIQATTNPLPPNSNVRLPLDLYLLADFSGSITQNKWGRIVGFARNLTQRMASMAGGYYQNDTAQGNGLRVGLSLFSCTGNTGQNPVTIRIIEGPSGNETLIMGNIDQMLRRTPSGGTCPSQGLNQFRREIIANREVEPLPRPTAIIILTDGDISRSDVPKTRESSEKMRALEDLYMFGINYGGGAAVSEEWSRLIEDSSRIFEATNENLDRIATLLSVVMLGTLTVEVEPTSAQLARVEPYIPETYNGTTVCLGEDKIPFYLSGRSVAFFSAGELLCTFKRLENSASHVVSPVEREGKVYCEVPASLLRSSLGPNEFIQRFSLQLDVVSGNSKTTIFNVPDLTYHVAVCLEVEFTGSNPGQGDNCFPPADPNNSSVGVITVSGPTSEVPGTAFYCKFDNNGRFAAQLLPGGGISCRAPAVDLASALQQGTDPTPFRRFVMEVQDGTALLDSNVDATEFTPVSCLAVTEASKLGASYCYNSSDASNVRAVFDGTSLTNLVRAFSGLEFTCLYKLGQKELVTQGDLAGTQVTCAIPLQLQSFFADAYSVNATRRNVEVSLQTRSSQGSPARGWWVLGSDVKFSVLISPCVDVTLPDNICIGDMLQVGFSNVGVNNFLLAARPSCRFLNEQNQVIATVPLADRGCAWPKAIPRVRRVEVFNGARVFLQTPVSEAQVTPCFEYTHSFPSSETSFCWGNSVAQEHIVVEGPSLSLYGFPPQRLPTCRFDVTDRGSQIFRSPAKVSATNDGLVCALPSQIGKRQAARTYTVAFSLEDTENGVLASDPTGPLKVSIQSCVQPTPPQPDPRDVGKALPNCSPTCCLQSQLEMRFDGSAAEDIITCDWLSGNGTILATTPARAANMSGSLCTLDDWRPLISDSALPVTRIVAYADTEREIILAEEDVDLRRPCVWTNFATRSVTLGAALGISFNGPTVRSLRPDQFSVKCALMAPGRNGTEVKRMVTATRDQQGGTNCELPGMYDSLTGSSIAVWTFPADSSSATKSPTSGSGRRRLRSAELDSSVVSGRQLQSEEDPFAQGVLLYSQTLDDVTVSPNLDGSVNPCFEAAEPALDIRIKGDGVPALGHLVSCEFTVLDESSSSAQIPAVLDLGSNELVCKWKANSSLPEDAKVDYNATVVRNDTGEPVPFFVGTRISCVAAAPAPPGEGTQAPTSAAGALGAGGIAGIVIALLALLAFLVFAILVDRKRKDDRRRKREAEEAARKRAMEEQENAANPADEAEKEPVNEPEIPAELIDPSLSKSSSDLSGIDMVVEHDGGEDDIEVIALAPAEEAKRKFKVGDCVQYLDLSDNNWRLSYVRNYGKEGLDYILEDERQPIPEGRIRWPTYYAGEAVEVRRRKDDDLEDWFPGVVAYADVDSGIVGLMGTSEEVPFSDVRPAPYQIGENVEERGPDGEWRPAVVVSYSPDGVYTVDGPGGVGLNRSRKRLRWPQYHGGDLVEVRDPDGENWRRATVVTMEGGIVVGLEDGKVDPRRFPNCDVRRPQLKSAPLPPPVEQSSILSETGGESPRRKFNRREPLDFQELPDFCFEITVDKSHGLGVRFGWTRDQLVVVQKFLGLPGLDAGPLEASMRVSLGDQLLAINGASIGGKSFSDVTDMVRNAPDIVTLKFGRWKETVKMKAGSIPPPRMSANASGVDVSLV